MAHTASSLITVPAQRPGIDKVHDSFENKHKFCTNKDALKNRHCSFTELPIKAGELLRGYHATCACMHIHTYTPIHTTQIHTYTSISLDWSFFIFNLMVLSSIY